MRNLNRPWTDDERKRLGEAIDAGVSVERAVAMFKRTSRSLRQQAYKQGKRFQTPEKRDAFVKAIQDAASFSWSVPIKKSFEEREAARRAAKAAARAPRR